MPRQPTITKVRLNNISKCVAITAKTFDVLVDTLNISGLEAISNTIQSLLKLMQTIKQDKNECAELMEHTHELLNAIIIVYIKSDTGAELPPSTLNQIAKFTETLLKIHTFFEAQQSSSKVKMFFRQGELSVLLKDCRAGLQQGFYFFNIKTVNIMKSVRELQDQAQLRHQEILNILETMPSSDSASSISKMYSASYASSNSISMLPAEPKIFHGRDSELADILKLFNQGTPRIAILGAGGMGKTSLARTVLHHEEITTKYHGNRFFVTCDTASGKAKLASLIGAHLGLKPGKDMTQAVLWHLSSGPANFLILDNLETLWEPVESRNEIEEFLSLLTGIASLALVITMRGAERPAKVQWTRPFLLPLQPLAQDAARKMFIDIADDRHLMKEVDEVLCLTDNMPLSISLLAHLVDMEGCSEVLSRWKTEKTSLISEGYDRRSNLELSISLSLASPRITSVPNSQDLLALLSMLPDGLSDVELKQTKFPIKDILGCKIALLRTALAYTDDHKRLKVLVPVREYMGRLFPPTAQMIRPLFKHFCELLKLYVVYGGKTSAASSVHQISSNFTNIENILQHGLLHGHSDTTDNIYCACDFNKFSRLIRYRVTPLLEEVTYLLPSLWDHQLKVHLICELFQSLKYRSISHPETLMAQALDHLKHFDNPDLESRFHDNLGVYYSEYKQDIPTALKHFQTALSLAQSSGNYERQSRTLLYLSQTGILTGDYAAVRTHAKEGQRLAKISGDLFLEAGGLYQEAHYLAAVGNYKHCIGIITRAKRLLALVGMAHGEINHYLMELEASVHVLKSEYVEAYNMQNQLILSLANESYDRAFMLLSIAAIEVEMGVSKSEIQQRIDASQSIAKASKDAILITDINIVQADLNLREGDVSSLLFRNCLKSGWGKYSNAVSASLMRLGDHTRWKGSHHPSSWTTVFLAHSLKVQQRLQVYQALQFLGDVMLSENDGLTAISLFILALEGFTHMDIHHGRAECMIRLGDLSKTHGDSLKALEFWETAKPLFERSSQSKRVQDIDERLDEIGEDVKEQYRRNLTQLTELVVRTGKAEEVDEDEDLSEGELHKEEAGLVVA